MAERSEFDAFVTASSARLLRTAFLMTHDRAAAEDLLQTAYVHAWRAWRRVDGDPLPYVRRILANEYASSWRRKWRDEVPTGDAPDQPALPHASVEDRDAVWTALGRLPRRQRAVLVLRYYEDLSESDTAAILGIAAGTVKSQASKALARLRIDPSFDPAMEGHRHAGHRD